MPSLRLSAATVAFGDRVLLDRAHLHLTPGWTGLVGPNGAGKSTLLRVLAGEWAPGAAVADPPDLAVVRVAQGVEEPGDDVHALAAAWDRAAGRWRSRLGLGDEELGRWTSLSPGERRRWQVAAALWRAPDVLLLDEPDNHLDAAARARLVDALSAFRGIGVLVSHDRDLLDTVTTRTAHLADGTLTVLDGGWSAAQAVLDARAAAERDGFAAAVAARDAAVRRAARAQRTRAEAERGRSLRKVDPRDHDARSLGAKTLASWAERSHARAAARLAGAAARAEADLAARARPDDLGRDLFVGYEPSPRRIALALHAARIDVGAPARTLLRDVDLQVGRDDRIAVVGPNGAGKSTLLRALVQASSIPSDRLLALPQELAPADVDALVARLHAAAPDTRGRLLELVAALGVAPATLLATPRPSPGEARKLALALGLAGRAWALVLDEPTHHLDLPARRRLERALVAFPGAIVLVTHDDALARAVARVRWEIVGDRVVVRSG
jgi:ATPase subunit of ABC transporter with duplicated ATPase domains